MRLPVSTAVYQAVQRQTNVEAENLRLKIDGKTETVNVSVRPVLQEMDDATRGFILILFDQKENIPDKTEAVFSSPEPVARQLEEQLLHSQMQFVPRSNAPKFKLKNSKHRTKNCRR